MATLNKLIFRYIEELNTFGVTDDNVLDPEYMRDKILSANNTLFNQFVKERQPLDGFYQTVPCLEVEAYQQTCTVDGIVFTDPSIIYKIELPSLIKTIGYLALRYLGLHGFSEDFDRVSLDEFNSIQYLQYTGKRAIYTILGNVAICKNLPNGITNGMLIGILTDPTSACGWDDTTSEFPTPSEYKLGILIKKDIPGFPPDVINDAQRSMGGGNEKKKKNDSQDDRGDEDQ